MVSLSRLLRGIHPRRAGRAPDNETLKVALLAAASASPALERSLLGTSPAPGTRVPSSAVPEDVKAMRAVRAQSIAYELHANNGRYCSRTDGVAIRNQKEFAPHPLMWAVVPVQHDDDAKFFAPANDVEGQRLQSQLFRTLTLPGSDKPVKVALLPLQWEEAKTLQAKFPDLVLVEDGQIYRGSSPRSLFVGTSAEQLPKLVSGIEGYSIKMHLSADTYARLGGLGGNRDINYNDALFATVLSTELAKATADIPLIEIQSEGRAVAAKIGSGDKAIEVGAIFRKLTEDAAIPGFALFSPTTERLPHVKEPDTVRVRADKKPRYLAADAIKLAMQKDTALTKEDAFLKLFVDPLCDVNFQLFNRGWSMELHPQNFLLKFDETTGLTSKVVIRDLHGLGYSADFRKQKDLPDQMSLENLKKSFPDMTVGDIEGYFLRNGQLRDRYKPADMFRGSMDFFTSIFWYHLLDAVKQAGIFDKAEVTALVELIKDRVHEKADEHGFDMKLLPTPKAANGNDYWDADKNGVRGRILFRRAV